MTFPTSTIFLLLLSYANVITCNKLLEFRESCSKNYGSCSPKGATKQNEPSVGSALSSLYVDIVNTIDSNKHGKRDVLGDGTLLQIRASGGSLCCADGTQCLLLEDMHLPFCYDNYTTNYFLPGGSYGQITSGAYTSTDGSTANLISGNYTLADGTPGNIYGSPSSPSKPDTATLGVPTQYTASGTGSAIPVTALGQEITYTTTIPGSTISPSMVPETLMVPIMSGSSTVGSMTTQGPSSTIPGTTIAAETSTIITRLAGASPTKKGSADMMKPSSFLICIVFLGYLVQSYLQE